MDGKSTEIGVYSYCVVIIQLLPGIYNQLEYNLGLNNVLSFKSFIGYQVQNIQENIRVVSENLYDLLPCIKKCTDQKNDKDSIIPFYKSKVDLLFLVSEDDGVTNSVEQVKR